MSETAIPFNTAPKVGDAFFIHFPASTFEEPEDMATRRIAAAVPGPALFNRHQATA